MDDPTVRRLAEAHADAVVRADKAALDDFAPEEWSGDERPRIIRATLT